MYIPFNLIDCIHICHFKLSIYVHSIKSLIYNFDQNLETPVQILNTFLLSLYLIFKYNCYHDLTNFQYDFQFKIHIE
nr:hypothetical protein CJLB15_00091 [Campylobacter phage CJLB-15]